MLQVVYVVMRVDVYATKKQVINRSVKSDADDDLTTAMELSK